MKFSIQFNTPASYKERNTFIFLNQLHQFKNEINWNFQAYGKLWNYNLQYFNFLHQNDLTNIVKENLLCDIHKWLKKGQLKLEPYPVSLRIMNTIRYLSSSIEKNNNSIAEDTYAQLNYLYNHLEYHLSGNHLLENAFALLMGGAAFEEHKWIKKAKSVLYSELDEQILNDGGHFELSLMYHQVILFRVLELIDWYSQSKEPDLKFLDYVRVKAGVMLNLLKSASFKTGDIPHFNDSAPGIAFTSRELFAFAQKLSLTEPIIIPLKESGYRKFGNEIYECLLDVGSIAASYQPGHSHSDVFSFVLYKSTKPFIVDVGTSTYEIGQKRDYERSTSAHNTVVVQGQNQSEVWESFRVGRRASVKIINESGFHLEAKHNGYYPAFGIYHTRKFEFHKKAIEIEDDIGHINGKLLLHFHPDCELIESDENNLILIKERASVKFENTNQVYLKEYEFAEGFNQYRKAFKVEVDFKSKIKTTIKFL
ncbi:MAG: alginate lyase family protein [Chitinophagaceae bacterium]|nr:alginate lyase family protein [Chitinophagaceae bacterium]